LVLEQRAQLFILFAQPLDFLRSATRRVRRSTDGAEFFVTRIQAWHPVPVPSVSQRSLSRPGVISVASVVWPLASPRAIVRTH
jgi:hypothetical protein